MRPPIFALVATYVMLGAGCGPTTIPSGLESPGRLHVSHPRELLSRTENVLRQALRDAGQVPEPLLLRVGHVLGAYREYPMVVDEKGAHPHSGKGSGVATDAVPLMKRAFDLFELNSVEFDVHAAPANVKATMPEEVVVVHNMPEWEKVDSSSKPADFFKKNTLRLLLEAYVKEDYWRKGTKLYIEVKAPPTCESSEGNMPDECLRIGKAIAGVLNTVPDEVRPSLAFVSFWPRMLEVVHDAISKVNANADVHDYVLILGPSSAWWATLASGSKGNVPHFDEAKKKWLSTTHWVDSVWASPSKRASAKLGVDMAWINHKRQAANASCLRVGVSTYQSKPEAFDKDFRSAWSIPEGVNIPTCGRDGTRAPAVVESLIYDIDTE